MGRPNINTHDIDTQKFTITTYSGPTRVTNGEAEVTMTEACKAVVQPESRIARFVTRGFGYTNVEVTDTAGHKHSVNKQELLEKIDATRNAYENAYQAATTIPSSTTGQANGTRVENPDGSVTVKDAKGVVSILPASGKPAAPAVPADGHRAADPYEIAPEMPATAQQPGESSMLGTVSKFISSGVANMRDAAHEGAKDPLHPKIGAIVGGVAGLVSGFVTGETFKENRKIARDLLGSIRVTEKIHQCEKDQEPLDEKLSDRQCEHLVLAGEKAPQHGRNPATHKTHHNHYPKPHT